MPRNPKTFQRAKSLHEAADFHQAIALYRQILRDEPDDAFVLDFLAQALEQLRRLEEALYVRRQSVRAEPGNMFLRDRLAGLLVDMAEPEQSVEVWRDLVRITDAPEPEIWLAKQLAKTRRIPEAMRSLEEQVRRRPDDPRVVLECALLHERMGDDQAAAALSERVLAAKPDQLDAGTIMARIESRAGRLEEARRRLERLAALPEGSRNGRVHAVLAQTLDKLRDYDAAFRAAEKAQRLHFDTMLKQDKDRAGQERMVQMALELTREAIAAWPQPQGGLTLPAGVPGPPVFVVGFPRSGTTLIEQMLSAHPNLAVSDELPNLQAVRQKMYADIRRGGRYPADLGSFTPRQVALSRQWYFERSYKTVPEAGGRLDGGRRKRIVDKQPLNTVEMCFARLIFPDSPVLYIQRDPRDTVVSIFMQGFNHAVPHLFSLEGSARLYALFAEVWEHYEKVLGMRTARVVYEDLVADPEGQARRMVEFIGEAWNEAVMNYHAPEHRRFVTTPSYSDVAKPVYKRAMGRWKKYEKHLAPVMPTLEPWVRAWGYE